MYKMILFLSIIQQNTFGNLVIKSFYCKYGLHCTISSHWQTVTKVGQLLYSGLIEYTWLSQDGLSNPIKVCVQYPAIPGEEQFTLNKEPLTKFEV